VDVVRRHSYGRQLGRIADAVEALIEERGDAARVDERVSQFNEMKDEIDEIKNRLAVERVDRMRADLTALRKTRPDEYARLRDELHRALEN
jgi:hypothetical protein